MSKKPNILLVMPDQLRADSIGLAGHPTLITPNIDEIGGEGCYFENAYTTCPSCIPARCSLLTGLYPSTSGVVGFKVPNKEYNTLPKVLSQNGYTSTLIGRNMHQNPEINENPGYDKCILGSTYIRDDDYAKMIDQELPLLGGFRGLGLDTNGWQAKTWPYAEYLHPTNWIIMKSREYLENFKEEKPLFLTTSFYAPHPPFFPPEFYFNRYLQMEDVDRFIGDWADPIEKTYGVANPRVNLNGEKLKHCRAGYYGLINHIDDQLTWFLKEFKMKSKSQGRPWVIVFTTDHGEMLGDHHYFRKCEPFEGSSHIPLLIQSDGFQQKIGHKVESPVCLEDIMPTLLDFANVPIPKELDGNSLLPLLLNQSNSVRDWLHCEHSPCYNNEQAFQMITNGIWKYIWRPITGREHLFNLKEDPKELLDLITKAENQNTLNELRTLLTMKLKDRPEKFVKNGKLCALGGYYPPIFDADSY